MENKKKSSDFRDKRRYKYGSLSVVFTIVFIALILVINLVLSSLSLSGDLTVDLTQENFTEIGEESMRLLSELGKDLDITIYFMAARDTFDNPDNEYNGINLTTIIRDLAEKYQETFNGSGELGTVKVEYKELDSDPEFEKKYLEESATQLTGNSVIVQGKYHYRVLALPAFFNTSSEDNSYYSFNGEYRFTTAMLQSSISEPMVVTLTYGHGEPINSDGLIPSDSKLVGMVSILSGAGFEIKTANLSQDELDSRTEILICYDPVTDFNYDEIDKINAYLAKRNSFITFVDSKTPELPNLQSCLNDNWGINYKPFYRVTDETHSISKYENINARYPSVEADSQSGSAAYQIRKSVTDIEGTITTVLPESVELFKKPGITQDGFVVEEVLSTYDTAKSGTETESGTEGEMPLMLLSTKSGYGQNNVTEYSYVLLVGSTEFADTENMLRESYGNKRVILAAARIFGSNRVAPDISAKPFGDTALNIELGTAMSLTALICSLLPLAIIIMGFVIFFIRRHK